MLLQLADGWSVEAMKRSKVSSVFTKPFEMGLPLRFGAYNEIYRGSKNIKVTARDNHTRFGKPDHHTIEYKLEPF